MENIRVNGGGMAVQGPRHDDLKGDQGNLDTLSDLMDREGNISADRILDLMGDSLENVIDFLESVKQRANAGEAGKKGEHINMLAQQWIHKLENKAEENGKQINTIG